MYPLEDIATLYRGRRFSHTPILNQAIDKVIDYFGGRGNVPPDFMLEFICGLQQHGLPDGDPWKIFYEPCPVIKITTLEVVCTSQNMSPEILEAFPDFYAGGTFHVSKAKLQRDGKAYHSRHGEYCYLNAPVEVIALPEVQKTLTSV